MIERNTVTELLDALSRVLLGAFALGMIFLLIWAGAFALCKDIIFRLHGAFFAISRQHFDAIHYAGMALVKGALFLGFLFPALAIRWELRRRA
jgi:ABC-type transport system involved in cytochrome c biogenesis permease subunit